MELYGLLPEVAALLLLVCSALLIGFASRRRWFIAVPGSLIGGVLFVLGSFALVVLLLIPFFVVETKFPPVWAPDGGHSIRAVDVDGGATEGFVNVELRAKWHIWPSVVFYTRYDDPRDLQFRWIDRSHLLIRYPERAHDPSERFECTPNSEGVHITCEPYVRGR